MKATQRLQIRVCAILWDEEALLVQAPRQRPSRWALPGGRLEAGETLEECLRREFAEEMAVALRVGRLVFVHENFFSDEGTPTQEYGFYFLCEAAHTSAQVRAKTAEPVEKHLLFRWVNAEALADLALFPAFLRTSLSRLPEGVRYLSTKDRDLAQGNAE